MKKSMVVPGGMLVLAVVFSLLPATALMQEEVACDQNVIVQAGDSLSKLADGFYGDVLAFPAIAEATNAIAAEDDSYATIEDVNVLEVGWKLCIPNAADAQAILDRLPVAGAPATRVASAAPNVDRVGLPEGYQEAFKLFYEFDRPDNQSARVIYANDLAASITPDEFAAARVEPGEPFPYGSILVMEVYRTQKDDAGNVLLDVTERYERDELSGIFVMRKEPGFGAKYGAQRNGEWEYMAYRPDGTPLVPPERTNSCAACHVEAGQGRDWVFGAHRFLGLEPPAPGENQVSVVDYTFTSANITATVGTTITWTSHDVVFHTVTSDDMSFNSGALRPEAGFNHVFEEPGTFEYFCAIHPSMTGKIVVTE